MSVRIEDNVEITTTYHLAFTIIDERDRGYGFPCDENGIVDEASLKPLALINYKKCLSGEHKVGQPQIDKQEQRIRLCSCGSGEHPEGVYDARGIFVASVCDKCRKERLKRYRPEIFSDSDYEADEPIEPEEY